MYQGTHSCLLTECCFKKKSFKTESSGQRGGQQKQMAKITAMLNKQKTLLPRTCWHQQYY